MHEGPEDFKGSMSMKEGEMEGEKWKEGEMEGERDGRREIGKPSRNAK